MLHKSFLYPGVQKKRKVCIIFFNTGFFNTFLFLLSSELSNLVVFSSPILDRWSNSSFNTNGPLGRHGRDLESNYKPHLHSSLVLCLPDVSSRAIICHVHHSHSFFNEKIAVERNRYKIIGANSFIQSPIQANMNSAHQRPCREPSVFLSNQCLFFLSWVSISTNL